MRHATCDIAGHQSAALHSRCVCTGARHEARHQIRSDHLNESETHLILIRCAKLAAALCSSAAGVPLHSATAQATQRTVHDMTWARMRGQTSGGRMRAVETSEAGPARPEPQSHQTVAHTDSRALALARVNSPYVLQKPSDSAPSACLCLCLCLPFLRHNELLVHCTAFLLSLHVLRLRAMIATYESSRVETGAARPRSKF